MIFMLRRLFFLVCCLSLAVGSPAPVRAELIIGNFPSSPDTFGTNVYNTNRKAMEFVMGATPYVLDEAVLRMNFQSGTPIVEIRTDDGGGHPGSLFASLTAPDANGGGPQSYSFTPTSPTTLAAGTKYWLYVYGVDANPVFWYRSNPNATPSGGGATFEDSLISNSSGSPGTWSANFSTLNSFELLGHTPAVPEPSSLALIATAGLAAGARRRFFRR
jgi:hypothetical protein